jgi:hypothetical protein
MYRNKDFKLEAIDADSSELFSDGIYMELNHDDIKPYLRPMSSMTEEEYNEFKDLTLCGQCSNDYDSWGHWGVEVVSYKYDEWDKPFYDFSEFQNLQNWLNKNMFDYRGLIPMGLALEAPENMYFQQKSDDELKKDVAKKLIDVLIYDNDYVNRMTPLDESRHYGNWIDYVAKSVTFPDDDKKWWDKEDRIDIFAVGDYHDKEDMIKNYPSLRELDTALNKYYDYLNEKFKI